jgi:carbonic anhydrase/acetyltransferase-like protein (isoleucine patch superfamily)
MKFAYPVCMVALCWARGEHGSHVSTRPELTRGGWRRDGSSSPTGLSAATTIGDYVTVGAGSILRSTTIGHGAVVGKKCILMEGSVVRFSSEGRSNSCVLACLRPSQLPPPVSCLLPPLSWLRLALQVEKSAMLEPGTVVAPGRLIPAGQLWGGNPAAFVRALTEAEVDAVQPNAEATWLTAEQHRQQFLPHSFAYVRAPRARRCCLLSPPSRVWRRRLMG